jgi:hypothetical protein
VTIYLALRILTQQYHTTYSAVNGGSVRFAMTQSTALKAIASTQSARLETLLA